MVGERSLSKARGAGTVPVPGQQSSVAGCSRLLLPPGGVGFGGVFDHFICFPSRWAPVAVRGFSLAAAGRSWSSLRCAGFSARWLLWFGSTALTMKSMEPAQELSRTGSVAPCVRNPPGPGIEPVSPASAAGFLVTAPPGKSPWVFN